MGSLSADAIGDAIYASVMEIGFGDRQSQEQMDAERKKRFEKELEKKENSIRSKYKKGFANGVELHMRHSQEQERRLKCVPDVVHDINHNGIDDDFEMDL